MIAFSSIYSKLSELNFKTTEIIMDALKVNCKSESDLQSIECFKSTVRSTHTLNPKWEVFFKKSGPCSLRCDDIEFRVMSTYFAFNQTWHHQQTVILYLFGEYLCVVFPEDIDYIKMDRQEWRRK